MGKEMVPSTRVHSSVLRASESGPAVIPAICLSADSNAI